MPMDGALTESCRVEFLLNAGPSTPHATACFAQDDDQRSIEYIGRERFPPFAARRMGHPVFAARRGFEKQVPRLRSAALGMTT
jgi:hypothetical protein